MMANGENCVCDAIDLLFARAVMEDQSAFEELTRLAESGGKAGFYRRTICQNGYYQPDIPEIVSEAVPTEISETEPFTSSGGSSEFSEGQKSVNGLGRVQGVDDAASKLKSLYSKARMGSRDDAGELYRMYKGGNLDAGFYHSMLQEDERRIGLLKELASKGSRRAFDELIRVGNSFDEYAGKACYAVAEVIKSGVFPDGDGLGSGDWYEMSWQKGYALARLANDQTVEKYNKEILGKSPNAQRTCPICHSELVLRPGLNGGKFLGCRRYPNCTYTTNSSTPIYKPVRSDMKFNYKIGRYEKR